ncbi:chaplin [Streptomyces boninensis]|uniref:chaplin n=1 Tax=Streptomyces boninensis TaxID=2039455 RepID=UPI003B21B077
MNTAKKAALAIVTAGLAVGFAAAGATADAKADGTATNSPGVGSGNVVQAPVNGQLNVTGNTANVGGVDNDATGNTSTNS